MRPKTLEGDAAVAYKLYVCSSLYRKDYTFPQPKKFQIEFSDAMDGKTLTGSALVLARKKLSLSINGQRRFDFFHFNCNSINVYSFFVIVFSVFLSKTSLLYVSVKLFLGWVGFTSLKNSVIAQNL